MTNKINLPPNALEVFIKRYSTRDEFGKSVESVSEIFERVARVVAEAENHYRDGINPDKVRQDFYSHLSSLKFLPNGRTIANAGSGSGQLANCFVLPISDDLGKMEDSIFSTLRNAVLILQSGGGVGFSFGSLRHKGAFISTSKGKATGAVSFLKIYDTAFWVIGQGGGRRSACMAVLPVNHPDILDFISCKEKEGEIEHFNISVAITDEFMQAVLEDKFFNLIDPHTQEVVKKIKALTIFNKIAEYAYHNGEPGLLFIDAANRDNPVPNQYKLEATNPCFTKDTRISTQFGLLKIEELTRINQNLQIPVDNRLFQNKLGTSLVSASSAHKTGVNQKVYEITTKKGYQITATANHKFFTKKGFKQLSDLKVHDKLYLQSGEGNWNQDNLLPNTTFSLQNNQIFTQTGGNNTRLKNRYQHLPKNWSFELGLTLGWLIGDGWITAKSNSPLGFVFGKNKDGIEGLNFIQKFMKSNFTSGCLSQRPRAFQLTYGKTPALFFNSLGISDKKASQKQVPESIFSAPRQTVIGFLQGLFSADGTVELSTKKQSCTVRLSSSSKKLLQDVQILLLNFGILSSIHFRRKKSLRLLPDSQNAKKYYETCDQYELILGKQNRDLFCQKIGFFLSSKQTKLEKFIKNKKRKTNQEEYLDEIIDIKYIGKEDVYDLTEPETHSLIANGFIAHNCGEQWLGPGENCCMASINLKQHVIKKNKKTKTLKNKIYPYEIDWLTLQKTVEVATRFLDDVVEVNKYVPAIPLLKEAAFRNRRIGISIMGLADLMYLIGVSYGSNEAQDLASQIMEFIRFHTIRQSISLVKERGTFPGINESIYNKKNFQFKIPKSLIKKEHNFNRPKLDWRELVTDLKKQGIRNAAQTTIAPTGAIATVAGLEGYGCEPVFSLSYIMKTHEGANFEGGQQFHKLYYQSSLFDEALKNAGISKKRREEIFQNVSKTGTCQNIKDVPEEIKKVFIVSSDLNYKEHVMMQAALQQFVDNSISKTVNLPSTSSIEDVKKTYMLAWKLNCKGLTVYVTGSRSEVILETGSQKDNPYQTNGVNDFRGKSLVKQRPGDNPANGGIISLKVCPECGSSMQKAEGCITCPKCGWSKCDV